MPRCRLADTSSDPSHEQRGTGLARPFAFYAATYLRRYGAITLTPEPHRGGLGRAASVAYFEDWPHFSYTYRAALMMRAGQA